VDTKGRRYASVMIALALLVFITPRIWADSTKPLLVSDTSGQRPPVLEPVSDPLEPVNRAVFEFNAQLTRWVIGPLSTGYRLAVPTPVRKSISRFGENIVYPKRLLSTLLQTKWEGAWIETERFFINTTAGGVGFFDPASRWGFEKYDEDFGQAFGWWGIDPGFYFMLPFLGPSSCRDTVGLVFDTASNPLVYVPGASTAVDFNDMSFVIPSFERLVKTDSDPYAKVRDVWALSRESKVNDYVPACSAPDPSPTLNAIYLTPRNPKFTLHTRMRTVRLNTTGEKFPYNYWLQKQSAPLLFILPGVGGHRISASTLALAEMAYNKGFNVVTVSSSMNWEFMETAASVSVPGFTPNDVKDIYGALNAVYLDLNKHYPNRFTATGLIGVSLGGTNALFLSHLDYTGQVNQLHFDRCAAICPPIDFFHAMDQLDGFYNAPMRWPVAVRAQRMESALLKAAALLDGKLKPGEPLPFDRTESEYLIGCAYRYTLRDCIYTSQEREDTGILKNKIAHMNRKDIYEEIDAYSFHDYCDKVVFPYYHDRLGFKSTREELIAQASVRALAKDLESNPKLRVFINEDDFLLSNEDIAWLKERLGNRLYSSPHGGHLGSLGLPEVQDKVMSVFEDLKTARR
jgi:ABC-type transporter lipoprotein component MlaA